MSLILLLLPQALPCNKVRVFPQFAHSALAFTFVFRLEFVEVAALAVGIIVTVGDVSFFELGDRLFDGKRAVVV